MWSRHLLPFLLMLITSKRSNSMSSKLRRSWWTIPASSNSGTSAILVDTTRSSTPQNLQNFITNITETIDVSYQRLEAADEEGRTATGASDRDGSWLIRDRLLAMEQELSTWTIAGEENMVQNLLCNSPWPTWVNITDGSGGAFELSLLTVPAGLTHEPRRHPTGTILCYKHMFGAMRMTCTIGQREISREELPPDAVLTRLAGKTVTFESLDGMPAGVLEVALYPPKRNEEGYGDSSGFAPESLDRMTKIDLTIEDGECMFIRLPPASAAVVSAAAGPSRPSDDVLVSLQASVGGLGPQLRQLVRRMIASRQVAPELLKKLGVTHVKGVLLYGPPGCGKTLIARQLALALGSQIEPKIVNGPEILAKYVGEAEANIRELFRDAEEDWHENGPRSGLHVIVFDELDSIARSRGAMKDASGVRDSCVNQLLSKLDGVRENNNVLVIGLTNRKDLIDTALLRPGRLEVHLEVGLPDLEGRVEILQILLAPLAQVGYVPQGVVGGWVGELARRTGGYSGADLSGLMRQAASYAMERWLQRGHGLGGGERGLGWTLAVEMVYDWDDFERSLR